MKCHPPVPSRLPRPVGGRLYYGHTEGVRYRRGGGTNDQEGSYFLTRRVSYSQMGTRGRRSPPGKTTISHNRCCQDYWSPSSSSAHPHCTARRSHPWGVRGDSVATASSPPSTLDPGPTVVVSHTDPECDAGDPSHGVSPVNLLTRQSKSSVSWGRPVQDRNPGHLLSR